MPNTSQAVNGLKITVKKIDLATSNAVSAGTNGARQKNMVIKTSNPISIGAGRKASNGRASSQIIQYSGGIKEAQVYESDEQPNYQDTGNKTHLAIQGEGYFVVGEIQEKLDAKCAHTINPTLNTGNKLAAAYGNAGIDGQDLGEGAIGGNAFRKIDGTASAADDVVGVVAPVNVIPLKSQANRAAGHDGYGANAIAAPKKASGDGLKTLCTRVGNFRWDTVEIETVDGAVHLKHTDNRLVTSNGSQEMFVVGWVNVNVNHPTNKRPQWEDGHMDVARMAERYANGTPINNAAAADAIRNNGYFKAVPCTKDNMCVIRIQNLKDYSNVQIDQEGNIIGYKDGEPVILAKIAIAKFDSPDSLRAENNSNFSATPASGDPKYCEPGKEGTGSILSGTLEGSNIDTAKTIIDITEISMLHKFIMSALRQLIDVGKDELMLFN